MLTTIAPTEVRAMIAMVKSLLISAFSGFVDSSAT